MGFKEGLKPFIGLDGTFLKGKAKGQLLVAVGQDNMNHFYPLAWAIVDKEIKRTWNWFLGLLQHSLELQMGEGIRIKVMNQLREHEDSVTKWSGEFSPKTMKLYNEYMKIAQVCELIPMGIMDLRYQKGLTSIL